MLTGLQIRAARAALSITAEDLAGRSGVSLRTVQRLELIDGPLSGRYSTISAMKSALEAAGVEFVGTPDDRPGIRMHLPRGDGTRR